MKKPNKTAGLRHVALFIQHFKECEHFYVDLIGMDVVWRPDDDNLYLSTGSDNLALHRAKPDFQPDKAQRLDHLGFFLQTAADVDEWHDYFKQMHVPIVAAPKDHRDGTRSFYCKDPDGNVVQMIHVPMA